MTRVRHNLKAMTSRVYPEQELQKAYIHLKCKAISHRDGGDDGRCSISNQLAAGAQLVAELPKYIYSALFKVLPMRRLNAL